MLIELDPGIQRRNQTMKHILLLTGPVLFLLAELIAPGGSPDPARRQALIANNQAVWALSHQLFILALAGLIWWLVRLWATLTRAPLLAGLGIVVSGFALLADFGIATLQLLALDAVRTLSPDQALAVITLTSSSQNLLLFVFLPYLGIAIGFVLLACAIFQQQRRSYAALLALSGILLTIGGVTGSKLIFIIAALTLLAFTLRWVRDEVRAQTTNALAPVS
jgi:hypothetical protein